MTFSTREVTTRLINRKIIFWTGEVNSRNQSKGAVVRLFKRDFAGSSLSSLKLDEATPLRITLFDQIAFHLF
jgi:hypothetical protein